ncbi:MAG: CDP-alcohol phosphatidyltransferase family protein [Acidobacteria bacterium]|nr:CDP-alcohol phosphatidyltransferase family protein [Acidobacteriota bacterium]
MNREPRGYNVIPAVLLGLGGTIAGGFAAVAGMELSWGFVWLAAFVYVALMSVVTVTAGNHHPFPRFGAANLVTTTRAAMTALVAGTMAEPHSNSLLWWTIGALVIVAISDGLDGALARRSGLSSDFGARFDMETDAALIGVLSVLVWQHEKAGIWVLMCGLMRYAFVAAGWLLPWLARPLRSTRRGKTVAVLQFVGLGVALAPVTPVWISVPLAAATLVALAWSFAIDVIWLRRRAPAVVHHAC